MLILVILHIVCLKGNIAYIAYIALLIFVLNNSFLYLKTKMFYTYLHNSTFSFGWTFDCLSVFDCGISSHNTFSWIPKHRLIFGQHATSLMAFIEFSCYHICFPRSWPQSCLHHGLFWGVGSRHTHLYNQTSIHNLQAEHRATCINGIFWYWGPGHRKHSCSLDFGEVLLLVWSVESLFECVHWPCVVC